MAYTSQTKIEQLFGTTLTAAQAAALSDILVVVKRYIDNYTGKTFEGGPATRYYDGNSKYELLTDTFYGSPTVVILNENGTTQRTLVEGQGSDFITTPYNTTEKSGIILTRRTLSRFPWGASRVKITANWGYAGSVPADIQYVATKLAYQLLSVDTPEGMVRTSVSLGDYSASFQFLKDHEDALGVFDILDQYVDLEI